MKIRVVLYKMLITKIKSSFSFLLSCFLSVTNLFHCYYNCCHYYYYYCYWCCKSKCFFLHECEQKEVLLLWLVLTNHERFSKKYYICWKRRTATSIIYSSIYFFVHLFIRSLIAADMNVYRCCCHCRCYNKKTFLVRLTLTL